VPARCSLEAAHLLHWHTPKWTHGWQSSSAPQRLTCAAAHHSPPPRERRREKELLKRVKGLYNEELAEQIRLEKARAAHDDTLLELERLEVTTAAPLSFPPSVARVVEWTLMLCASSEMLALLSCTMLL
jgi:hypothetical protein